MNRMIGCLLLLAASSVMAHSSGSGDGTFKTSQVSEQVYMLQGTGGNIGMLKGSDGVLLIDDDYKVNAKALVHELEEDSALLPRYVINTHWHGDHTGGNEELGKYAIIIAHDNVRTRLSQPGEIKLFNMKTEAQPKVALPVLTYDQSLFLHFNDQRIEVLHYPNGHTDGDSIVYIQPANVVHMGDHYFAGMYPFVDLDSGGDVAGVRDNLAKVIAKLPADVKIIPGHGSLSTLRELKAYQQMLADTLAVVKGYVEQGLSLEQAQERGLPEKFERWGKGFINETTWIMICYQSITRG